MTDDAEDIYPIRGVNDSVCGEALIINIFTTKGKSEDGNTSTDSFRSGSKNDVKSLEGLFKYLNFHTMTVSDLTALEIKKKIMSFCRDLDTKYKDKDMCAVVVMGHGQENIICGRDGEKVHIKEDILDRFSNTNCPSMIGKPKLFVFQSCRGYKKDTGIDKRFNLLQRHDCDTDTDNDDQNSSKVTSVLTDSLEAYSTVDDYVAFRCPDKGGFFIQKMCEVFHKNAHQDEIHTLFRRVSREVKKVKSKEYVTTPPEIRSRMDKALYFKPDIGSLHDIRDVDSDDEPDSVLTRLGCILM